MQFLWLFPGVTIVADDCVWLGLVHIRTAPLVLHHLMKTVQMDHLEMLLAHMCMATRNVRPSMQAGRGSGSQLLGLT